MAGMSFVKAKSIVDEAAELRNQMAKKAADALVKCINPIVVSGNKKEGWDKMDQLLKDFSMEDRYVIMKHVFMMMC